MGCILLVVGVTLTVIDIYRYDFIDNIFENDLSVNEIVIEESLNNKNLHIDPTYSKVSIIEDNTIEEGMAKLVITYYEDIIDLNSIIVDRNDYRRLNLTIIIREGEYEPVKKMIDITIKHLKERKIYNYSLLFRPDIKIYVNSENKPNIRITNN
jgi:hypothetical protein